MTVPRDGDAEAAPARQGFGGAPVALTSDNGEEWLERVLIACEEARASGLTPPDLASLVDDGSSGTEACERVNQALATLELLRGHWTSADRHLDAAVPGNIEDIIRAPRVPGTSLGRYEILGLLGAGGHGIVFLAHDPSLRRKVALKVPRLEALASRSSRDRFFREARAVARLDHPGIVPIHDFGEAGPVCYLATAFVEGPNLADWLDVQKEPVDPDVAARLTLALAEAVAHAHSRGVLHRDLKPANVLLESSTRSPAELPAVPRITDFGLAKLVDEVGNATRTGALPLGTPGFAAPELIAGATDNVGPPADVYGLGAILHTLLTGLPPPSCAKIDRDIPAGHPDLPRSLKTILDRCLEVIPEDRYPTADAFADDLRRYLAGEPVRPRYSIRRRIRRMYARRGWYAASAGILLVAGLIGLTARIAMPLRIGERSSPLRDATTETVLSRHAQYVADIQRVFRFLTEDQDVPDAERILDRWAADAGTDDPRGFEWGYLQRLAHRATMTLRHDRGDVYCVRFSADGRRLASAGQDGTARIWDALTGRPGFVFRHPDEVNWIELSPDDRLAATACDDGVIRLWDILTGQGRSGLIPGHGGKEAVCVRFMPDGKRLVSGGRDGRLVLWDVGTGRVLATRATGFSEIESLDIARDGSWVYAVGSGQESMVRVFAADLSPSRTLPHDRDRRSVGIFNLAVSPDNRHVAAAYTDGVVSIWNTPSGEYPRAIINPYSELTYGMALAPGGTLLATGGAGRDPNVRLWDAETAVPRDVLMGHTNRIWCVAFAPDDRRLGTASRDGTIKLWTPAEHAERTVIPSTGSPPTAIGFASDSATLLVDRQNGDVSTYKWAGTYSELSRRALPQLVSFAGFSADGHMLARNFGLYHACIYDLQGRREMVRINSAIRYGPRSLAFSPDGLSLVASNGRDPMICVFGTTKGELLRTLSPDREGWNAPLEFTFSRDGRSIAFSTGFAPAVWDLDKDALREASAKSADPIISLALSPDGQSLAASDRGNSILIYDTATLTVRSVWRLGLGPDIRVITYSPDGRLLATGDGGGTVRLSDVATGETMIEMKDINGRVEFLRFSPDGAHLAAASPADGRVVVWHSGRR